MPNTFMDFVTILQDSLKQGKDISEMIEGLLLIEVKLRKY